MKELLTKRFWEGVRQTFDDAREGVAPAENAAQIPAAPEAEEGAADPAAPAEDSK
jgi:hypothetical protein